MVYILKYSEKIGQGYTRHLNQGMVMTITEHMLSRVQKKQSRMVHKFLLRKAAAGNFSSTDFRKAENGNYILKDLYSHR